MGVSEFVEKTEWKNEFMRLALLTGSVTIFWPSRKTFGLARSFVADFTIVWVTHDHITKFKHLLFLHN